MRLRRNTVTAYRNIYASIANNMRHARGYLTFHKIRGRETDTAEFCIKKLIKEFFSRVTSIFRVFNIAYF